MARTRWSVLLWIYLLAVGFWGCGLMPATQEDTPVAPGLPTDTIGVEAVLPTVAPPASDSQPIWTLAGSGDCQFTSDGDQVADWYWLRDEAYRAYSEWICSGLPVGVNLPVILLARVDDRADGNSGYSTPVRVIYSLPSGDKSQAVQVYLQNPLDSQTSGVSNSASYQTTGYLVIPAGYIDPEGAVQLRLERFRPSPYQVAMSANGLYFVSPHRPVASTTQEGELQSNWRWLRDPSHQSSVEWEFRGLDGSAPTSILTLEALVTQGVDGGSG